MVALYVRCYNLEVDAFENHTIENQISAQKRAQVQLSSPRVTAKNVIKRPPQQSGWVLNNVPAVLVWTLLIMVATLFLLVVRVANASAIWSAFQNSLSNLITTAEPALSVEPSGQDGASVGDASTDEFARGSEARAEVTAGVDADGAAVVDSEPLESDRAQREIVVGTELLPLLMDNDFKNPNLPLAQEARENMWLMGYIPNIYRIRVFPGYAAWSTVGVELTPPFRVETSVVIVPESPRGYAGMVGRYQDESNFYLFAIDGEGESQLQLHQNGEWTVVTEWLPTYAVEPAGRNNILAVEDDGSFMRFYVNGAPIHEIRPLLDPGAVGLAGGTRDQRAAESNFHWIRIYAQP